MRMLWSACLVVCPLLVGCQSESASTVEATPVTIDAANLEVVNFSVPDVHCEFACAPKVREALAAQPGVAEVEVDVPSKTAWVKADKTQFDAEAAVAALVDIQFDASRLISAEEAAEARAAATAGAPAAEIEAPAESAPPEA